MVGRPSIVAIPERIRGAKIRGDRFSHRVMHLETVLGLLNERKRLQAVERVLRRLAGRIAWSSGRVMRRMTEAASTV